MIEDLKTEMIGVKVTLTKRKEIEKVALHESRPLSHLLVWCFDQYVKGETNAKR